MAIFIENKNYHEETLYPLVKENSKSPSDKVFVRPPRMGMELINGLGLVWEKYTFWGALKCILTSSRSQKVYFNTLESLECLVLAIASSLRGLRVYAIAHNIDMFYTFSGDYEQGPKARLMRIFIRLWVEPSIKKLYVLDPAIVETVGRKKVEYLTTQSLTEVCRKQVVELQNETYYYILIIGDIVYSRRDYNRLLRVPEKWLSKKNIKFVFAGNSTQMDGVAYRKRVRGTELEKHCIFFERYLSYSELFFCVKACHEVLLLHISRNYGYVKTSAATHIAHAFDKPVMNADFLPQLKMD